MINRFSTVGLKTACLSLFLGSAILLLPLGPAQAAQKAAHPAANIKTTSSKLAQAEPTSTGSISKAPGDEQPGCDRARRRLWIEGEGWVVRRVSTCY